MRKKALQKEFFMSVKKTRNRFISIFLLALLGTAFYSGIRATNPDMQMSADIFYDESQLMDIRVMSTLGMTDDDVEAIEDIEGVESAMPVYSADVLTKKDAEEMVVKLISEPEDMNLISVDEGRMPETSGECLVDNLLIEEHGFKIGDTITVTSGDDTAIGDTVEQDTYTIVGRGRMAYYMNLTRDSSTIGNGSMAGFVIIPKDNFTLEAYTEIDVTVDGARELDCYGDEYKDLVSGVTDKIEAIADVQCQTRYDHVISEAEAEIADAEKEVSDGRKELEDAKKELDDGDQELEDARAELEEGQRELEDNAQLIDEQQKQLDDGSAQLADGWAQYWSGLEQAQAGEAKIDQNEAALNENAAALDDSEAVLEEGKTQLEAGQEQIDANRQMLEENSSTLSQAIEGIDTLNENLTQTEEGLASVAAGLEEIEAGKQTLAAARTELDAAKAAFEQQKPQIEASLSDMSQQMDTLSAAIEAETDEEKRAQLQSQWDSIKAQYDALSAQLSQQEQTLADKESELSGQEQTLADKESELTAAQESLNAAKSAIEEQLAQMPSKEELEAQMAQVQEGLAAIESSQQALDEKKAELDAAAQALNEGRAQIQAGQAQIQAGRQELADSYAQLESARQTLEANEAQAADGQRQLDEARQALEEGRAQLDEAEKQISENEKKLADAREEYNQAYEENMPDIESAEQDIADARAELEDIEVPEWYVLDRDYFQSCVEYAQDAERIGAIGEVFPFIFFLVAALVSLTTMTRMVEEERTQIGTLKALGYGKVSIAAKYILYAFLATFLGGVVGTVIGQTFIPYIIMNAYAIAYVTLTDFVTPLHFVYTSTSLLVAVIASTAAVIAACYNELRAVPAQLMRPESPKAGKRVLLERVTFIWKRLSFSNKSTVRNLFRYKKRFFMTIIGIGGCMGLLLVGFGVKDSIMTIGDKQYQSICLYDGTVTISDSASDQEKEALYTSIQNEDNVSAMLPVEEETVDVAQDDTGLGSRSSYLVVPSDISRFSEFIDLHNRQNGETYTLDDSGAVISEKLAKLLDVSVGDEIYIEVSEMQFVPVTVSHIAENYFYHYVYVSPQTYEQIYGEAPQYHEVYMNMDQPERQDEEAFSSKYLKNDIVAGVSFTSTVSEQIESMIVSMDAIIYVIIISAGLLAFVVLYNLNNINISERKRELATLKVLGFYDIEVSKYVFRENILLTLFGSVFGVFLGIILHRYVILTAEIDLMMFGRNIYFRSYIYSILLTFLFSFIVNIVTHWKLKKIDMIESLKSVE